MSYDNNRKFYVVWVGHSPGIYDSWEECKLQTEGFPGAKYKSFKSQAEATAAYRGDPSEHLAFISGLSRVINSPVVNYAAFPEIRMDAIAVDGACSHNPGPMEYRAVRVADRSEVFRIGPMEGGTNNIAEFLAIIHCAALLHRQGDFTTPIYSDSRTALSWIKKRKANTKVTPNGRNARVLEVLARANNWIANNDIVNPLLKWDTDTWGEIPADFGRK